MSESILVEAQRIVHGDRNADYGHPLDNHTKTAEAFAWYIASKYGITVPLTAEDVCWFNVLQKIARECNLPKRDNKTDVAGYTANVQMIEDERERRAVGTCSAVPTLRHIDRVDFG